MEKVAVVAGETVVSGVAVKAALDFGKTPGAVEMWRGDSAIEVVTVETGITRLMVASAAAPTRRTVLA